MSDFRVVTEKLDYNIHNLTRVWWLSSTRSTGLQWLHLSVAVWARFRG
jgi:hypothetical protein